MSAFFLQHPKETDLALFAGGESGPLSRWRVERHIENCRDCKQIVADYFHLSEELQPLAELPELDWDAMALGIERQLAREEASAAVERRPAIPAMAWAASLAAVAVVCGIVVVRQQPLSAPAEEAPAASVAAAEARAYEAPRQELFEESEPAQQAVADQDFQSAGSAAPAEQDSQERRQPALANAKSSAAAPAAPAVEPARAARLEKRESSDLGGAELALADEAAPPPPPAPLRLQQAPSNAAEPRARAFSAPAAALREETVTAAAVQPLFDSSVDVRVAADGWVRVRSISADGRLTITDVYEP